MNGIAGFFEPAICNFSAISKRETEWVFGFNYNIPNNPALKLLVNWFFPFFFGLSFGFIGSWPKNPPMYHFREFSFFGIGFNFIV
jgi:hypothetical protein